MKFKKVSESLYVLRLEVGDEIIFEIESFCSDLDINCADIKGIGACNKAELAHFNVDKKEYSSKIFDSELEICSMQGLYADNKLHMHAVMANNKFQAFGGHLKSAIVSGTAEIIVRKINTEINKKIDEETTLNILDI
jgi:predicted DNA-binding protein with PD1-like motif